MTIYDEPRLKELAANQFLREKDVDETHEDESTFNTFVEALGRVSRSVAETVNPMSLMTKAIVQPEKAVDDVTTGARFVANTAINSFEDVMKVTADMEDGLRQMGVNVPAFSLDEMRFKSSDEMLTERRLNAYATGDATSDMNMGRIGNRTEIEKMLKPIASCFFTSWLGGGITKAKGILTGAATIDLNEGNLSTVLKDFGILPEITGYLSSKPENAEVGYERLFLRTKNLVEEGVLSAAFLALPLAFQSLKNSGVQFTLGTKALTDIPQEKFLDGDKARLEKKIRKEGSPSQTIQQNQDSLKPIGQKVTHPKFGDGEVISHDKAEGSSIINVKFNDGKIRRIDNNYVSNAD